MISLRERSREAPAEGSTRLHESRDKERANEQERHQAIRIA
jgi:hypothetical protein